MRALIRTAVLSLAIMALAMLPVASHAQELSGTGASGGRLYPMALKFRNTTAANSVARNALWDHSSGYTDSTVFRHAAAAPTSYDTTIVYAMSQFPLPPTMGPAYIPSIADTLFPWIFVRFAQDTTQYGAAASGITSGMDSVRVWAEFSSDKINWYTAPGTPTYRFDVVFATSGADGLQSPTLIGVESLGAMDEAIVPFKTHLNLANGNRSVILNAPDQGRWKYIRFIFGGDYVGQFMAEALTWSTSQGIR